ncbi:cache domain-containing protein [Chloroflexota bacterium]
MKLLPNLTLRKKVTLLTALGLILGISVFSYLGLRSVNQATETMLQDRLTTAHIVAEYLDEILILALTELQNTVHIIENNEESTNVQHQLEILGDTYRRLSINTHSIYLLNENGQIIWSKPESPELLGTDISFYTAIGQVFQDGEASISNLVSDPLSNTPVILLTSPVNINRQGSMGIIVVAIDLVRSSIGGFVRPIRLGNTGYVEIVDQNGIVVARTDPGPLLAPFEKSDHSGHFAALIAAGEPTRGLCHTCHEPVQKVEKKDVLAFVPLSQAKWGVIIRQTEDEALAPVRELGRNLIFFGVVITVVALFFVIVPSRDLVNRVRMLTVAARKIANGDLISPVTASQKDEIGILAQSLEDMRIKLRTSYEELENLHREVQREDDMRRDLLRDIFSIQEEERRRIARELHDETSQVLASVDASLEAAVGMLPPETDKVKALLTKAQALSVGILDEVHKLIYELRPSLLDDLGLVAAVRWLIEINLETQGISVNFDTKGRQRRLPPRIEITLFRVIQEIVNNIARHSHAQNTIISLHFQKNGIRTHIRDDGKGFDVEEAIGSKDRPRGLGLIGIMERVAIVNGTSNIKSNPKRGTETIINIPLN